MAQNNEDLEKILKLPPKERIDKLRDYWKKKQAEIESEQIKAQSLIEKSIDEMSTKKQDPEPLEQDQPEEIVAPTLEDTVATADNNEEVEEQPPEYRIFNTYNEVRDLFGYTGNLNEEQLESASQLYNQLSEISERYNNIVVGNPGAQQAAESSKRMLKQIFSSQPMPYHDEKWYEPMGTK